MSMCSRMLFLMSPITPFAGFEPTNCGLQARCCTSKILAQLIKKYHLGKTAMFIYWRFAWFKIKNICFIAKCWFEVTIIVVSTLSLLSHCIWLYVHCMYEHCMYLCMYVVCHIKQLTSKSDIKIQKESTCCKANYRSKSVECHNNTYCRKQQH